MHNHDRAERGAQPLDWWLQTFANAINIALTSSQYTSLQVYKQRETKRLMKIAADQAKLAHPNPNPNKPKPKPNPNPNKPKPNPNPNPNPDPNQAKLAQAADEEGLTLRGAAVMAADVAGEILPLPSPYHYAYPYPYPYPSPSP